MSSTQTTSTETASTTNMTVSVPATADLPPNNNTCLLKTAIAKVHAGSHYCKAQILFDEGAQRSFMTQQLAQDLNIRSCQRQRIVISAFGGEAVPKELQVTSISLQTNNGTEVPLSVLIVPKIAAPLQNLVPIPDNHFPHLQGLPLAHPVRSGDNFEITLFIRADFNWKIFQGKIIRGNGRTAVESKIGYLLSGPLSHSTDTNDVGMLHVETAADAGTHINKFWDVEFTGTLPAAKSTIMSDQQLLTAYINSSVSQGPDGSYIVNFPWKADHPPLPSNRNICERRMRSLARKLARTPELLKVYGDIISDQVKRGFIEKVRESDVQPSYHFIPHHAVK